MASEIKMIAERKCTKESFVARETAFGTPMVVLSSQLCAVFGMHRLFYSRKLDRSSRKNSRGYVTVTAGVLRDSSSVLRVAISNRFIPGFRLQRANQIGRNAGRFALHSVSGEFSMGKSTEF